MIFDTTTAEGVAALKAAAAAGGYRWQDVAGLDTSLWSSTLPSGVASADAIARANAAGWVNGAPGAGDVIYGGQSGEQHPEQFANKLPFLISSFVWKGKQYGPPGGSFNPTAEEYNVYVDPLGIHPELHYGYTPQPIPIPAVPPKFSQQPIALNVTPVANISQITGSQQPLTDAPPISTAPTGTAADLTMFLQLTDFAAFNPTPQQLGILKAVQAALRDAVQQLGFNAVVQAIDEA